MKVDTTTTDLSPFGRRPKRQRTPTTMYTDDQPGTYTRKGVPVESKKPSFYFVEEESEDEGDPETPTKRSYRRRKPYHKDDMLEKTTAQKLEELAAAEEEDDDDDEEDRGILPQPATTTTTTSSQIIAKRKRGRPPKKKAVEMAAEPSGDSKMAALKPAPVVPDVASTSEVDSVAAVIATTPLTQPLNDKEGVAIAHAVKLHPIVQTKANWKPLYQPNVYFDADYEEGGLPPDLPPVTRQITCLSIRKPLHDYLAVGDTMGFCTIYSLGTHIRPVARLETVACQQRAREEQQKLREQQRRKRKYLTLDTSSTQINALGIIGERVVLATSCELECLDIPTQTSLWVCPLGQDRLVTFLDMHPTRYDVLVSCRLYDTVASYGQTSPLMLLQHSSANVEVCDANAPILLKSPCCTAIWDQSKHVENRLLFVAVSNDDLELVLVQGGSIDNWKVACKTRIPVKSANHSTRLQQSGAGTYTLVACSRGIRLYQTETLQLIHVYGDQLALHGQSVVWKDCLMMGGKGVMSQFLATDSFSAPTQYDDLVKQHTQKEDRASDDQENDLGQYVVGVAQKGPKELTETLHVWRVEQANVVPAISLPLPAKSQGVQALIASSSTSGDRLVLATQAGGGFCLEPKMESDFAGIMYPAGYRVITDNVDYMENEDELDHVVVQNTKAGTADQWIQNGDEDKHVNVMSSDAGDADLREAMRRSLLEQKLDTERRTMKDEDVDVISPLIEGGPVFIPCRPEAYLRDAVNSQPDDDLQEDPQPTEEGSFAVSPAKPTTAAKLVHDPKVFVSQILESLGHSNPKKHEGGGDFSFSVTAKVVIASAPAQAAANKIIKHGKKSRAANLEATLKASIDLKLQRYMFSKQACGANGKGSTLRTSKSNLKLLAEKVTPSVDATIELMESTPKLVLQTKVRQDETDVALGLLGLSPSPANGQNPDADMASDSASRASSSNVWNSSESQQPCRRIDPTCHACRGRHVIHSCGTRALPIDFDEVAKQERLRRDREEEEKKKARAEKRRLADQRRREARKHKQRELEEQRQREKEEIRLEQERIRRVEEASASVAPSVYQTTAAASNALDFERQRREMIVASYASHLSHSSSGRTPVELNSVHYSRDTYDAPNPATAAVAAAFAMPTASPPPQEPPPQVSSYPSGLSLGLSGSMSMGTLSSADALVALAGLAGIKAEQQEQATANGHAVYSAFSRPVPAAVPTAATVPASHGFGASRPATIAAPRLAIPSFAVIRGQVNGQGVGVKAPSTTPPGHMLVAPNGVSAVAPESNGTSAAHVWPASAEGNSWPSSTS